VAQARTPSARAGGAIPTPDTINAIVRAKRCIVGFSRDERSARAGVDYYRQFNPHKSAQH
jgi:hypothetical protein